MADPGQQPDFQPSIQSFLSFLNRGASSFEVVNPDPPEGPTYLAFAVRDKVQAYLEENGQEKLKQIIATLFPQGDSVFPNDILPNNIAVFCTLLKISKGKWIKYFRRHKSLSDDKLPFDPTSKPPNWPEDTGDPTFLEKFCEEQWKFCVPVICQPFADQHFPPETILPIVYKKSLNSGGSATLWLIKLDPAYNQLISENEKARLKDSADTFVLKTYFTAAAPTSYAREVEAFRRLQQDGRETGIIGFHGSFTRGNTHNVLLQYADKGTLEDYFRNEIPPVEPEEIIQFWEALFKIIDALRRIHQTQPDGAFIFHGWHQDVRPENILVVSNGSENTSQWEFKLADLGTSHFKRVDASRQDSTASDSYGTRTYGAPECYRPDERSVHDKLRVGQNVDIWSLGCVYSELARWMRNQYKGVQAYRGERRNEISKIPEFRDADCFHNGDAMLAAVRESHKKSTTNLRTGDSITKAVVERMIPDMLDISLARPTAEKLWYKSKGIVAEAKKELKCSNNPASGERRGASRSAMNRSQTVPQHGPPAPPNPPPDISPPQSPTSDRSYQQEETPYRPKRRSQHGRGDPVRISPSPSPIDTDGQQSQSPDSIAEDYVWTPNPPGRGNPRRTPHQSRYADRSDISAKESLKQAIQTDAFVGPQSESSGMGAGRGHEGIAMNGGSPRGIRHRSSDYSEGYSPPPAMGKAGSSRRSNSPDEMEHMAFSPTRHSRHVSRGESSHSRLASDNSTLSTTLGPVAQPSHAESPIPIPQMRDRPSAPAVQRTADSSTPPPERWSVEEALEWKRDRKDSGIQKPIPNPQLHDRLRKRDHVFLVDDSATMKPHWKRVTRVFEALSYILKDVDPNGLDLSFTISGDTLKKTKRTSKLVEMVKSRSNHLVGTTDMNLRLTEILVTYQTELEKPKGFFGKPILPRNLYILTDGVWEPNCDAAAPIKNLVNKLNTLHKGRVQVGIQFISFGENTAALERLDILDSGLSLKPDIVDHEPSDGDVWKMLLGSTNDYYDSQNEQQQTHTAVSQEDSSTRTDKD